MILGENHGLHYDLQFGYTKCIYVVGVSWFLVILESSNFFLPKFKYLWYGVLFLVVKFVVNSNKMVELFYCIMPLETMQMKLKRWILLLTHFHGWDMKHEDISFYIHTKLSFNYFWLLIIRSIFCDAVVLGLKEVVDTDKAPAALGPYSQAIQANNLLFVSGVLGLAPEVCYVYHWGFAFKIKFHSLMGLVYTTMITLYQIKMCFKWVSHILYMNFVDKFKCITLTIILYMFLALHFRLEILSRIL